MAGTGGASARDLISEIRHEGYRFRFGQAVRLLALAPAAEGASRPPLADGVRFRTPLSLSFPASEIQEARPRLQRKMQDAESGPAATEAPENLDVIVGFMGLTGPSGTLPTHYTETLIERQTLHRDTSAHAFFDLFSHRAVSLFYQAWRKYRFFIPFEAGERDGFTRNLLDLVGVGLKGLQERLECSDGGIPDLFLIHFAGLLAQKPVSAQNLEALLRGYFRVPVSIDQYVGQWIAVPPNEQTRVGLNACALGQSAFVGERIWDRQNKVRVRIGPLTHTQFADFLPGKPAEVALKELVMFCVGHSLACDVTLVLAKDSIPAPALRSNGTSTLRLGYNIWPRSRPVAEDSSDMQFALLA